MDAAVTLPRQRGLTEQAADAAIDTACRLLRLPSIRDFNELAWLGSIPVSSLDSRAAASTNVVSVGSR